MPRKKQTDLMKPLGPPKRPVAAPKLSVTKLVRGSDPKRRASAKKVAVRKIRTVSLPKNNIFGEEARAYRVTTYSKDNQHDHIVTVFVDSGEFTTTCKPLVDCSCPDFVYTYEYALAKRFGNALLWRCNGEPPGERNPGQKPGGCKHVLAALTILHRRARAGTLVKNSRKPVKLSLRRG